MRKEKVFLVQKLIDDFGGLTSMHQKTGVPIGTIQYWQRMGKIPEWRIKFIDDICQQFGLDLQKYKNQEEKAQKGAEDRNS